MNLNGRTYMKTVPDFTRPPKAVREHIKQFYEMNASTYARIWDRLGRVRDLWGAYNRQERIALLKMSYINSVMSVRVPWEKAERTFELVMNGASLDEAWDVTNHGLPKKKELMKESLADDWLWEEMVDRLNEGNVTAAHEILYKHGGYVGTAKAPFTLANLGFVEKMCIDGNISNLLNADAPSVNVEEYESLCSEVQEFFPGFDYLEPYELQWLLFDYQRKYRANSQGSVSMQNSDGVATHATWFRYALGDPAIVVREMSRITVESAAEIPMLARNFSPSAAQSAHGTQRRHTGDNRGSYRPSHR